MNDADQGPTQELVKAHSASGDNPGAETETGAAITPQKPADADAKANAERTWDISDWFKIS